MSGTSDNFGMVYSTCHHGNLEMSPGKISSMFETPLLNCSTAKNPPQLLHICLHEITTLKNLRKSALVYSQSLQQTHKSKGPVTPCPLKPHIPNLAPQPTCLSLRTLRLIFKIFRENFLNADICALIYIQRPKLPSRQYPLLAITNPTQQKRRRTHKFKRLLPARLSALQSCKSCLERRNLNLQRRRLRDIVLR